VKTILNIVFYAVKTLNVASGRLYSNGLSSNSQDGIIG
jgi:hypothetical protein